MSGTLPCRLATVVSEASGSRLCLLEKQKTKAKDQVEPGVRFPKKSKKVTGQLLGSAPLAVLELGERCYLVAGVGGAVFHTKQVEA